MYIEIFLVFIYANLPSIPVVSVVCELINGMIATLNTEIFRLRYFCQKRKKENYYFHFLFMLTPDLKNLKY